MGSHGKEKEKRAARPKSQCSVLDNGVMIREGVSETKRKEKKRKE
jgi:hypothetical protein